METSERQQTMTTFHTRTGGRFSGEVLEEHKNPDGQPNGIVRVQVTDPGNTFRKVGDRVDVGLAAMAPIHPDDPDWPDLSGDELRQARIHFLTHDPETGEDTGHLSVPCSRWGRNSAECAEVAADLAEIMQEANGEPDTAEGLEHVMGLVVNDHDDVGSLFWEHGTKAMRERYTDELEDFRPREVLSSGHFSLDQQLADAVSALNDDESARFLAEFPEWKRVQWEGSWIDTEAMSVDVEWSSWAIDWIEANTPIQWDGGEPYRFDMSR